MTSEKIEWIDYSNPDNWGPGPFKRIKPKKMVLGDSSAESNKVREILSTSIPDHGGLKSPIDHPT